jgi:ribosomal protein L29
MVGVTGHHLDGDTQPQEIGGLSKIGLSICFASILAAIQFGIAGWYLASSLDPDSRMMLALVFGFVGACVVLIIDRNFIYAADTSTQSKGYLTYSYLAIRIFLILVISSLSSQFTLPLLLKSELEIHVQDLRDERYDTAKDRYNNKHDLPEKIRSERELTKQITQLKSSLTNLPQSLVHQKLAAEQCLREYKKKVNSAMGPEVDDEEVANLYAREKIQCEQKEIAYKEAYKLYITPRQAELALKNESYKHVLADANQAQTAFKTDLERAEQNNAQFLNASSSDVLWSLIRNNPGARAKYLMLTLAQLVLELMPLLLKSLLGRSPLGVRIAIQNQGLAEDLDISQHRSRLAKVGRDAEYKKSQSEMDVEVLGAQISTQKLKNQLTLLKDEVRGHRFSMGFSEKPNVQNSKNVASTEKNSGTKDGVDPISGIYAIQ